MDILLGSENILVTLRNLFRKWGFKPPQFFQESCSFKFQQKTQEKNEETSRYTNSPSFTAPSSSTRPENGFDPEDP